MEGKILNQLGGARESLIVCRNSQGMEVRATPLRLSRYVVVFEVYNPYSILQLSEVLGDFKIYMNERLVYSGRATVSNLLNTGILLVCEATLDESWLDVDLFSPVNQKDKLKNEFQGFLKEWEKIKLVRSDFKEVVADLQTLLMDLRRWLEQVELGIRSEPSGIRNHVEIDVINQLEEPMLPLVMGWFAHFDEVADHVDEDLMPDHRAYARRQLHPLVLCAPFVYRTFRKPLGYAGDYEMVNMILREPYEGGSLFAKVVNVCFLKNPPAEAHRNRIVMLTELLRTETTRVMKEGRRARVFNMGVGPAKEILDYIRKHPESDQTDFLLLDFNDETIEHTGNNLRRFIKDYGRMTGFDLLKKSVHQILKDASRPNGSQAYGTFDFVYCAGLFDYMSDRICRRLMNFFYDILAPGGLLVATNVDASKPFRHSMEFLLEWHLICRDSGQVASLAPEKAQPDQCKVIADSTGVNVFIEVRKPDDAKRQSRPA